MVDGGRVIALLIGLVLLTAASAVFVITMSPSPFWGFFIPAAAGAAYGWFGWDWVNGRLKF